MEYLFYIQLRESEESEMYDEEDKEISFKTISVHEYTENADQPIRLAINKISEIEKKLAYEGRVVVNFIVIYPSPTAYGQNDMSEVSVDLNLLQDLTEEENARFVLSFASINNQFNVPEAWNLYRYQDVYAIYIPVTSPFGNKDSNIKFCFWAPDDDADRFIGSVIQSADDIWLTFVGGTLQ